MFFKVTSLLLLAGALACSSSSAPNASTADSSRAFAAMSETAQEAARSSSVAPFLFPAELGGDATVLTGGSWVSVSVSTPDLGFIAQGQAEVHHQVEGVAHVFDRTVRGLPASTTLNEAIRVINWQENGVAYSLEIECFNMPLDDARCMEEDFAFEFVERLELYEGANQ